MIHDGTHSIVNIYDTYVMVKAPTESYMIKVILPSVISRKPIMGEPIVFEMDDVDDSIGIFVNFCEPNTVNVISEHMHYLPTDSTWSEMSQMKDLEGNPIFPNRPVSGGVV